MSNNGKDRTCTICGRTCKTAGALSAHINICRKRPTREEMAADCSNGTTAEQLAYQLRVSESTVRLWLDEYGLELGGKPELEVFVGYAPKYHQRYHECAKCNALPWCRQFVREFAWCLCEAPDRTQIEALQRRGVDLLQLTTELWLVAPEIWA